MDIQGNMVFMINSGESPQNYKLKSIEWAILTQLDGQKNCGEVASTLSLTQEEVQEHFSRLLDFNLVKLMEKDEQIEYVSRKLIETIEQELVVLVGPVASIIIDDILQDMNKSRETLETTQIGFFVEQVKDEIDDEQKKMKFLEIVLPKITQI